jgi:hypothetical protein
MLKGTHREGAYIADDHFKRSSAIHGKSGSLRNRKCASTSLHARSMKKETTL